MEFIATGLLKGTANIALAEEEGREILRWIETSQVYSMTGEVVPATCRQFSGSYKAVENGLKVERETGEAKRFFRKFDYGQEVIVRFTIKTTKTGYPRPVIVALEPKEGKHSDFLREYKELGFVPSPIAAPERNSSKGRKTFDAAAMLAAAEAATAKPETKAEKPATKAEKAAAAAAATVEDEGE